MKQNRLISIGTFILVLALSGLMTGCMEKDVYDPNREKEPLPDPDKYFGFEMRSDVRLSVNYDIYGFTPLIEIYGENPMETVEGTPIKKEGIEALFKTYTDNSGKYEGKMQLPTYLNKVYLYTATWGLPGCIELEIKDNVVIFDMSAKSNPKTKSVTRASSDVPYLVNKSQNLYSLCYWGEGGQLNSQYMTKEKNIGNESILDLTDRMKTFFNKGGQDNSKLLGNGKTINISIKEDNTALNLIFLNRSASYNNTFGYYFYKTGTSVDVDQVRKYIIFPNVSFDWYGGQILILESGNKVRLLYFDEDGQAHDTFPAGYTVGWFLYADGFKNGYGNNLEDYLKLPDLYNPYNSNLRTSNPQNNMSAFVSVKDQKSGKTILGAEDGVNQSYCDLLFYVDATPGSSIDDPERPSIPDEGDKEEPKPDEDENVTGTLAFEDIWPSGGDYDMNDVIVEYERKVYFDKKNIVTKIVDEFTPVHDGATYVNAFAYQIDAAQIGDKITLPEGAILEKETSSIIVMSNAKQNIGNKYVVTREFNGSFLKNQLLSYNPYIIVKYSQGEQNRTEVHLPKHKATAYANQSLIGSNDDAYYIDRKGAYPFAIDIPMLGFTPVTERNRIDSQYPGFATWAKSMGNDCKDWYKK